ncbi:MAG: tRNA (adenosine(37)-N6)-threonylcarbamoyltransferase complex dimerization subunit type 1 TsaB, partial [Eubacteriales bacterium]|nr:tRNA (adenosine(37)-N6)-threonylcarbamoyltransferase complex dimerization subunit type 1 TsaB [Eubacteriales bacterium]
TAAVLRGDRILCEIYVDDKKTHSESLAPMVDDCLKKAGLGIHDIDLYCCAIGPGSYTGLRIGTAMIRAFAHASSKPAIGVNTLDALAQNAAETDTLVCPVIDARRGEVYTATYSAGIRITDYRAVPLATVLDELSGKETLFLGDAAVNYQDKIQGASGAFRIVHSGMVLQRAGSVGLTAYALYQKGVRHDVLEPFYLRETQAERVYAARHRAND